MSRIESQRVAWLLPAMGTGGISFQKILDEFSKVFPNTVVFTGQWPGYAPGHEDTFKVQEVGATKHIQIAQAPNGYEIGFSYASPSIMRHLFRFKPQIIFANAFSMWTAIALLLKWLGGWKVIIVYEGGSPTYESSTLSVRLVARKLMVRFADGFVVNSQSGKYYFLNILGVSPDRIFARPFLLPSTKALLQCPDAENPKLDSEAQRPVFLYVGQLIPRKGLKVLLEACALLKQQGYQQYTLLIVGDGEQWQELEAFAKSCELSDQVKWLGRVEYQCLGAYFQYADVFVFPTYEDIWGMVVTEAMAFGKPVVCSKGAGAMEMIIHGKNGFIFDPHQPQELAEFISQLIDQPSLISLMSAETQQIMMNYTPKKTIESFEEAIEFLES